MLQPLIRRVVYPLLCLVLTQKIFKDTCPAESAVSTIAPVSLPDATDSNAPPPWNIGRYTTGEVNETAPAYQWYSCLRFTPLGVIPDTNLITPDDIAKAGDYFVKKYENSSEVFNSSATGFYPTFEWMCNATLSYCFTNPSMAVGVCNNRQEAEKFPVTIYRRSVGLILREIADYIMLDEAWIANKQYHKDNFTVERPGLPWVDDAASERNDFMALASSGWSRDRWRVVVLPVKNCDEAKNAGAKTHSLKESI